MGETKLMEGAERNISRTVKKCLVCEQEFRTKPSHFQRRIYCSRKCFDIRRRTSLRGDKNPCWRGGRPKCVDCKKQLSHWGHVKGNSRCNSCRRIFCRGSNHYNWQDGKTKASVKERNSLQYKLWRKSVFERDGYMCVICHKVGGALQADHIKAFSKYPELRYDINNGRTLCLDCHKRTGSYLNSAKLKLVKKNVAVLGGLGFLGSTLQDELIERGNRVLVIDNQLVGKIKFLNTDAKYEWFDIRDNWQGLSAIFKKYDIEYVFNYVALPFIPECYTKPEQFFETDAVGVLNVILACEDSGVKKLLQVSSAEIYGTQKGKIDEDCFVRPQSTYGAAKAAADYLCQIRFRETGMPIVINRQFNCFGPRLTHSYVIPEIIQQIHKSDTIYLGNIESMRDFIFSKDAVCMAIEMLEKGDNGEVYNMGAEDCISIRDLAILIGKLMGRKSIKIKTDPTKLRPWDITRLQSNNDKLYRTIKYRPVTSFVEGLKSTIHYFKTNGNKWDF